MEQVGGNGDSMDAGALGALAHALVLALSVPLVHISLLTSHGQEVVGVMMDRLSTELARANDSATATSQLRWGVGHVCFAAEISNVRDQASDAACVRQLRDHVKDTSTAA